MPDSMAEVLADDPHGLLDEDAAPVVEVAPDATEETPFVDDKEVWMQMLRERGTAAWNEAMVASREVNGEDWSLDLSGISMYEFNFDQRDLRGVNFVGAHLEYCRFQHCDMKDTKFDSTSYVYRANFNYANLEGSNLRNAGGIDGAHTEYAIDYSPPLQDVTKEVAHHFLMEAIEDPESFIHEGLDELRRDGYNLFWQEDKLKFYISTEIQRFRDLCKEGECECETEHACAGECTCCSCYTNTCDCEKEHDYEHVETEEWYLATIVGHVEFQYNSTLDMIGNVVMARQSQHPHGNVSGSICWGDAEMPKSIKPIDYFIVMMGWILQHNPSDPYRDITTDLPRIR